MSNRSQAYLYGMAAVLLWSTVATAFKLTLEYLDFMELLVFSCLTSTITLFLILLVTGRLPLLAGFSRRDVFRSALLGALNPFLYYVVLFKAYSALPAQQAQPLNYTWPILLVVLSIPLLKQKIRARSIVAVFVSFVGVVVISTQGDLASFHIENRLGVVLATGSGVIWAVFWIYHLRDERDPVAKLFLNFALGLVFILAVYLPFLEKRPPPLPGLAGAVYVGLFEMGITFIVWLLALEKAVNSAQVSVLVYLSPFLSLVFIRFVLGEDITAATLVGLIFIVAGIVTQQFDEVVKAFRPVESARK